jgi:transposase-like protein
MRVYSREFRMEVVRRILNGEKVPALSDELGIHRKLLYEWTHRVNAGGESNLRQRGRPRKNEAVAAADSAPRQILKLERKMAHQQRVIEFFETVLRRIQSNAPQHKRDWRQAIFQTIDEMTESGLTVETMCGLARVGRSGYYRYLRTRD